MAGRASFNTICGGAAAVCAAALTGCGKPQDAATGNTPAGSTPVSSVFSSGPRRDAPVLDSAGASVLARALAVNGKAEAQVVEATRQAGVLTLRVRFQRASGADSIETIYGGSPDRDAVYLVAGPNKVFPLTDAEEKPLMTPDFFLRLGAATPVAGTWFGKFPAPPAEVRSVTLVMPKTEPLDNIAITDR